MVVLIFMMILFNSVLLISHNILFLKIKHLEVDLCFSFILTVLSSLCLSKTFGKRSFFFSQLRNGHLRFCNEMKSEVVNITFL